MPDTTPTTDLRHLFDAVESGEEGGDWPAFLDALDARDAAVRTAAIKEAEAMIRAHVGSPLASALFNNGVEFAADLVRDLAAASAAATPTPQEG